MARKVVWSNEAASDIEAIANYIAKDSPFYAAAFIQEIREASRSLAQLAQRGRIVPELQSDAIRELLIKQYRLIYQVRHDTVVVLTLIHGARNPQFFTAETDD